jgi:hypothetical protein
MYMGMNVSRTMFFALGLILVPNNIRWRSTCKKIWTLMNRWCIHFFNNYNTISLAAALDLSKKRFQNEIYYGVREKNYLFYKRIKRNKNFQGGCMNLNALLRGTLNSYVMQCFGHFIDQRAPVHEQQGDWGDGAEDG